MRAQIAAGPPVTSAASAAGGVGDDVLNQVLLASGKRVLNNGLQNSNDLLCPDAQPLRDVLNAVLESVSIPIKTPFLSRLKAHMEGARAGLAVFAFSAQLTRDG
jgi:hypothetical protein